MSGARKAIIYMTQYHLLNLHDLEEENKLVKHNVYGAIISCGFEGIKSLIFSVKIRKHFLQLSLENGKLWHIGT